MLLRFNSIYLHKYCVKTRFDREHCGLYRSSPEKKTKKQQFGDNSFCDECRERERERER